MFESTDIQFVDEDVSMMDYKGKENIILDKLLQSDGFKDTLNIKEQPYTTFKTALTGKKSRTMYASTDIQFVDVDVTMMDYKGKENIILDKLLQSDGFKDTLNIKDQPYTTFKTDIVDEDVSMMDYKGKENIILDKLLQSDGFNMFKDTLNIKEQPYTTFKTESNSQSLPRFTISNDPGSSPRKRVKREQSSGIGTSCALGEIKVEITNDIIHKFEGSAVPQDMLPWILEPSSTHKTSEPLPSHVHAQTNASFVQVASHLQTNAPFVDMDLLCGAIGGNNTSISCTSYMTLLQHIPPQSDQAANTSQTANAERIITGQAMTGQAITGQATIGQKKATFHQTTDNNRKQKSCDITRVDEKYSSQSDSRSIIKNAYPKSEAISIAQNTDPQSTLTTVAQNTQPQSTQTTVAQNTDLAQSSLRPVSQNIYPKLEEKPESQHTHPEFNLRTVSQNTDPQSSLKPVVQNISIKSEVKPVSQTQYQQHNWKSVTQNTPTQYDDKKLDQVASNGELTQCISSAVSGATDDSSCILCSKSIRSNELLDSHYTLEHPDSALHHCIFCPMVFQTKERQDRHLGQVGESCSKKYRNDLLGKIKQLNSDYSPDNCEMLLREYTIDKVLLQAKKACLKNPSRTTTNNDMEKLLGISSRVVSFLSKLDQSTANRLKYPCLMCPKKLSRFKAAKHYKLHKLLYLHCPLCTEKFLIITDFQKHLAKGTVNCVRYIGGLIKRTLELNYEPAPTWLKDTYSLKKWLKSRCNGEQCPMGCKEQMRNAYSMIYHLQFHKKQLERYRAGGKYMCPVCYRCFNFIELAVVHWKLVHPETTPKNVDSFNELNDQAPDLTSISESFKNDNRMSEHRAALLQLQESVLEKWETILRYVPGRKKNNKKHKTAKRKVKEIYPSNSKCEVCKEPCTGHTTLVEHLAIEHGINQKSVECPTCNKVFKSKKMCDMHIERIHTHSARVSCTVCGTSLTRTSLARHMLQLHGDPRNRKTILFKCVDCGSTYKSKDSLERHRIREHGEEDKRKILSCGQCSFQAKSITRLTAHMDAHNDGKPYACGVCGDTFKHIQSKYRHEQTKHKENNPIKCSVCSATFVQKVSLNRHMKIHEKLCYVCDVCGKKYSQTHPLMKHREKHHPEAIKVKPSQLLAKQQ